VFSPAAAVRRFTEEQLAAHRGRKACLVDLSDVFLLPAGIEPSSSHVVGSSLIA
jgi:hypothetical protein